MTNEQAIKVLEEQKYPYPEYYKDAEVNEAIDIAIKSLSRPRGYWDILAKDDDGVHKIQCPFCKYQAGSDYGANVTITYVKLPSYCEGCGAELKEDKADDLLM